MIDLEDADQTLVVSDEPDLPNDVDELIDGDPLQNFWDAMADAMEREAEKPIDYTFAKVMREECGYKVHGDCFEETSIDKLQAPVDPRENLSRPAWNEETEQPKGGDGNG